MSAISGGYRDKRLSGDLQDGASRVDQDRALRCCEAEQYHLMGLHCVSSVTRIKVDFKRHRYAAKTA